MVKAKFTMIDGRVAVVLGLSDGNLAHLKDGKAIYFDIGALKMDATDRLGGITVFWGHTEGDMAQMLHQFVGPDTEVFLVPHGDSKPQ